jgi:hypothetical protein
MMLPIALFVVAGAAFLASVLSRSARAHRREEPDVPLASMSSAAARRELDRLGSRDGHANLPNDVTLLPFPTPAMEALYLEGERIRHELDTEHHQLATSRRVRERVALARSTQLAKLTAGALDSATFASQSERAAHAEQLLVGTQSAIETAELEHRSRLDAVDAATEERVAQYWAANLRVRNRADPALGTSGLDVLAPGSPAAWRAQRAASGPGDVDTDLARYSRADR